MHKTCFRRNNSAICNFEIFEEKCWKKICGKIKVGQKRRDPGHARRTARFGGPVGHFLSLQEFTFVLKSNHLTANPFQILRHLKSHPIIPTQKSRGPAVRWCTLSLKCHFTQSQPPAN